MLPESRATRVVPPRAWRAGAAVSVVAALLGACSLAAPADEELVGSCDDGIKNGGETAVDCGGPADTGCASVRPCAIGQACREGGDCASGVCDGSTCAEGTCFDGLKNGDEGDVDCGGDCPELCPEGKGCKSEFDCEYFCDTEAEPPVCTGDTCGDGAKNGDESDIDCGGAYCELCPAGRSCNIDDDCESYECTSGACADLCPNGMLDGSESDIDCGGYDPTCPRCAPGQTCLEDLDCEATATCVFDGMGDGMCQ